MTDVLEAASPAAVAPQVASAPPKPLPKWMHNDRLVTLAITLVTWISVTGYATSYVDDSWRFTLWAARFNNVDWGSDLAFTYGPLVFLDGGPMHSRPAALGVLLVRLLMVFAFCTLVLNITHTIGMRRKRAILLTLGMVVFMVPGERLSELVVTLVAVWIVQLLLTRGHLLAWERAGFGALAGLWIAVKPSAGFLLVAVVLLASGVPIRSASAGEKSRSVRGGAAWALLSVLIAALVFAISWTLAGQRLSSVPGFLSGWLDVSNGFAEGMVSIHSLVLAEVLLAGIACGIMFVLARRWLDDRNWSNATLFVVLGGVIFWARQIGMGRADGPHLRDAAVVLTLLALVLLPHLGKRLGAIMFIVAFVQAATLSFHIALPIQGGPWNVATDLIGFSSGDAIDERRTHLAEQYEVPQSIRDTIGASTVHISPVDTNVAFAHPDMGFWMLPTVQHYVSYSEVLEERNVAALTGPDGPLFVLHKPTNKVDRHNKAWESPGLIHAIWCSFSPIDSGNGWTLLEARGQSCDSVSQVGSARPLVGPEVDVPLEAASCPGIVTFEIHDAERTTLDRLTQLVVRLPHSSVGIGDEEWPVFAATASQPHILAAPASDLDWLGTGTALSLALPSSLEIKGLAGYFGPTTTPSVVFQCWQKDVG